MTYDNNWRDHPDYRDELDYSNDVRFRYSCTPGGRFNAARKRQAAGEQNNIIRVLVEFDRHAGHKVDRARMQSLYRIVRKVGYRLGRNNLYAPPVRGKEMQACRVPPWPETQTSGYWWDVARLAERAANLALAAAYTFEREAERYRAQGDHAKARERQALADRYFHRAECAHVDQMDSEGEAVTLSWYEEHAQNL